MANTALSNITIIYNYHRKNKKNLSPKSKAVAFYLLLFFFLALYGNFFNKTINQVILWGGGPLLSAWIVLPNIKSFHKIPIPIKLYASLLILSIPGFIYVIDSTYFFRYYQVLLSNLFLMLLVFYAVDNKSEWLLQWKFIWISCMLVGIYSYLFQSSEIGGEYFRLSGIAGNANGLANSARIGVLSAILMFNSSKNQITRITYIASIFVFGYLILLSGSRGGFANLLFIIGSFAILKYFKGVKIILLLLIIILGGGVMLSLFEEFLKDFYIYKRLTRFESLQEAYSDESRLILYKDAWSFFSSFPLFGIGLGQFPIYSRLRLMTHTDILDIAVQMGIFAGMAYASIYIKILKRYVKMKKYIILTFADSNYHLIYILFFSEIIYGLTNPNWFSQLQMVIVALMTILIYKNSIYQDIILKDGKSNATNLQI